MRSTRSTTTLLAIGLAMTATPGRSRAAPSEPHVGLMIAGGIVVGVSYSLALVAAVNGKQAADRWNFVPVAGPFIAAGTRSADCKGGRTGLSAICIEPAPIYAVDGALQLVGTAMLGVGFFWRTEAARGTAMAGRVPFASLAPVVRRDAALLVFRAEL